MYLLFSIIAPISNYLLEKYTALELEERDQRLTMLFLKLLGELLFRCQLDNLFFYFYFSFFFSLFAIFFLL